MVSTAYSMHSLLATCVVVKIPNYCAQVHRLVTLIAITTISTSNEDEYVLLR